MEFGEAKISTVRLLPKNTFDSKHECLLVTEILWGKDGPRAGRDTAPATEGQVLTEEAGRFAMEFVGWWSGRDSMGPTPF